MTGIAHAVLFAVLLASSSAALVLPIVAALRLTGRTCLILLFARAALAVTTHVSIMLAGFCFGLVVGAIGEPRRLAKQLFSLTDGLLGPLFFVWLGASLDVRPLRLLPLAALLGVGAVVVHFVVRPSFAGLLASAQLGVPVAAATLGASTLRPGALITVVVAVVAAGRMAAHQSKLPG